MIRIYLLFYLPILLLADVNLYSYAPNSHMKTQQGYIIRESLHSSYFAYDSSYIFEVPQDTMIQSFQTTQWFIGSNLRKDYIVKKHPIHIASIAYNYSRPHLFYYVLNVVSESSTPFMLYIEYNGEKQKIHSKLSNKISIYNFLLLEAGFHLWDVYLAKGKKIVCNCPSQGNGYVNCRYFFGWIVPIQEEETLSGGNVHPVRIYDRLISSMYT